LKDWKTADMGSERWLFLRDI